MKTIQNIILFALVNLLICCAAHAEEKNQIKIGVCLSLVGEGARWSASQLNGMLLAEEDLNNEGANVKLVIEDTGMAPAGTVKCFKKMTEIEKASGIIGNIFGFLTSPIIPMAAQKKIPLISTSVSKKICPVNNDYFYSVSEQVSDITDTVYEKFFKKHLEVKNISIFAFDDAEWGNVNAKAVQDAAKRAGVNVLDLVLTQEFKPDLNAIYPKMLAKKPDAIFIYHEPLSTVKPLRELKYPGIIVHSNALGEQVWDSGKSDKLFEGVYYADIQINAEFVKKFKDKFNKLPVLEPHSGYEAVNVLVKAIRQNPENPMAALKNQKFAGVNGESIDFSRGCAGKVSKWGMYQIRDGVPAGIE